MRKFSASRDSLHTPSHPATRRRRAPIVEDLEGRRLLSQAVEAVASFTRIINATNMVSGPGGDLWVGINQAPNSAAIDRIGLDGSVTSFRVPVSASDGTVSVGSLAVGPDGNVWFDAMMGPNYNEQQVVIGKVTPSGAVTEYPPVPTAPGLTSQATAIVSGPGGDLYFGDAVFTPSAVQPQFQIFIGKVTTDGAVSLLPASSFGPQSPSLVNSLVAGSDGNLWFTVFGKGQNSGLYRISPSGTISTFQLRRNLMDSMVSNAPDGSLIVTGTTPRKTVVLRVSTSGSARNIPIRGALRHSFLFGVGQARGASFFSDAATGPTRIVRLSPGGAAMSAKLTGLPTTRLNHVRSIVTGPDGNLYLLNQDYLGRTPAAAVYRLAPGRLSAGV